MADAFQSTLWTVIRGARDGDERALREFTLKYRGPVIAYCRRRGFDSEAEDLSQEVFLRLLTGKALLQAEPSKGRFRSLVLAVTKHAIGNHVQRETAQKRGAGQVSPLGAQDVAAAEGDDAFDREWVAHLLERALSRLAKEHPVYHDTVHRFLVESRPYADIARETGKSEGEIKNYVYRGKQKLVDYLRDAVREYSLSASDYDAELRYLAKFLPGA